MNAACVSYCDMTSMDSYYSTSAAQGRDHQANPFRTFPSAETKYSPTFIPAKGQPYAEKSRSSPFQQECPSLDGAEEGTFAKYQLFMQRSGCKTPPEGGKLHSDGGLNGTLVSCFGECGSDSCEWGRKMKNGSACAGADGGKKRSGTWRCARGERRVEGRKKRQPFWQFYKLLSIY